MKRSGSTASFERCAELRQKAGMSIDELREKVGQHPSRSSYERLERGLPIRASNTYKIAHAINAELKLLGFDPFDPDEAITYAPAKKKESI